MTVASSSTRVPCAPDNVALERFRPSVAETRPDIDASDAAGSHGASARSVSPVSLMSTRPGGTGALPVVVSNRARGTLAVASILPPCHCALSESTLMVAPSKVAVAASPSSGGTPSTVMVPFSTVMVDRAVARLPRLSQSARTAPLAIVPPGTTANARASAVTSATSPVNAARSGSSSPSRKRPPSDSRLAPTLIARSSTV